MNQLILSNKEITTNFSDCNTLSDVIKKVEKDGWDNGNVICGITLNGMKLTEEDENKFHASSVTEINQIEFQLMSLSAHLLPRFFQSLFFRHHNIHLC